MNDLHDAIRARLDEYAIEDPADGDCGPGFQRQHAAEDLFAAVRSILDYADGLGEPFQSSLYHFVRAALGGAQ